MSIIARRLRVALTMLAALAVAALPPLSISAEEAVSARRLDLDAAATKPLVEGVNQDLGPLLAAARYQRGKDEPDAPRNRLTSTRRLAAALRAHRGVAYVVLAERVEEGDAVALRTLYVLEYAPTGAGSPAATTAPTNTPGKAAVYLDLTGAAARPLAASLQGHLEALLPPAGAGEAATVEETIAALRAHREVAYMVLAERAGEALANQGQVFVVPDVLRLSISDSAVAGSASSSSFSAGDAPEAEVVPDPAGGPPMIKFEFDPEKYGVTKKK